ncbi:MAG: DUF3347 domain-containing protein [Bacteroidetes bacterium]|nr:DUF3347 domain-containing protein [Bacteroidota bacterium]
MKNILIAGALSLIAALSITACNNSGKTTSSNAAKDTAQTTPAKSTGQSVNGKADELISDYLALKNALAKDNSNDAAAAGKALDDAFGKFDQSALTADQKKAFTDIADDAKENAEHIGKSGGKLPHQREHFDMLSKDMYDLVKLLGTNRSLYVDHCPMYNNQKGAIWLSESKAIENPYLGLKMPHCGTVKEELKP